MTKLGRLVGYVTSTNRLDFVSALDADPAYQWDTKHKLFNLVEVCALLSTVLVLYGMKFILLLFVILYLLSV